MSVKLDKNMECICKVHTITIVDERTSSSTTATKISGAGDKIKKKKKEKKRATVDA